MSTDMVPVGEVVRKVDRTPYRQHSDGTRPVSFITEYEVTAMAEVARTMGKVGERNELLILTTFQCALRISETLKLEKQHRQVIDSRHRLYVQGKGGKPRVIALPEALSHALGDYAGRTCMADSDRYFPITRQRAWRIIKLCAERAGISRRVYCHLLRHGGAIARLKRSGNPRSLQIHLGHADFKMTMRYLSTLQTIESLEIEDKVKF